MGAKADEQPLVGPQTALSVTTHSFSGKTLADYPAYVAALLEVKKAAAAANCRAGVFDAASRDAIVGGCDKLLLRLKADGARDVFVSDVLQGGGCIAVNMNVNEAIQSAAALKDMARINASQSTADVCATAMRLALFRVSSELVDVLSETAQLSRAAAQKFRPVTTLALTCLRDAMPVSLGEVFESFGLTLSDHITALGDARAKLRTVNIGGTVIGTGAGVPDQYRAVVLECLREVSGEDLKAPSNFCHAAQNSCDLGLISHHVEHLAEYLTGLATNLRLLSSGPRGGMNQIALPPVIQGSSFFGAAKVNPTQPETLIQCCVWIRGTLSQVRAHAIMAADPFLNVWDGEIGISVYDAVTALTRALDKFNRYCMKDIEPNAEHCEALARSGSAQWKNPS